MIHFIEKPLQQYRRYPADGIHIRYGRIDQYRAAIRTPYCRRCENRRHCRRDDRRRLFNDVRIGTPNPARYERARTLPDRRCGHSDGRRGCQSVLGIPALALTISAGFVLFSSLMIMWQVRTVIDGGEDSYISAALTLFISLYNIFSSLLNILLSLNGDD